MAEDLKNSLGWALIGTPDGMQATCGGCISDFDIRSITDLDNRHIEIHPGSEILCFYWEIRNKLPVNYSILYRFAREINASRPGSFYGSVLVSVNYLLEPELVYAALKELADTIPPLLGSDDRFISQLSTLKLPDPSGLAKLSAGRTRLKELPQPGSEQAFLPLSRADDVSAALFFKNAGMLLQADTFNRVYGSAGKDIINFVQQRKNLTFLNRNTLEHDLLIKKQDNEITRLRMELDASRLHNAAKDLELDEFKEESVRIQRILEDKLKDYGHQEEVQTSARGGGHRSRQEAHVGQDQEFRPGRESHRQSGDHRIARHEPVVKNKKTNNERYQAGRNQHQPAGRFVKNRHIDLEVENTPEVRGFWAQYNVYIVSAILLFAISLFLGYTEMPGLFNFFTHEHVLVKPVPALPLPKVIHSIPAATVIAVPLPPLEKPVKEILPVRTSKAHYYIVESGDLSLGSIIHNIRTAYPEIRKLAEFKKAFMTDNNLSSLHIYKPGEKLIYYLPQE